MRSISRVTGHVGPDVRPLDARAVVLGVLRSADRLGSITRMNRSACGFVASQSKLATDRDLKAFVSALVSTMCAISIETR